MNDEQDLVVDVIKRWRNRHEAVYQKSDTDDPRGVASYVLCEIATLAIDILTEASNGKEASRQNRPRRR